MKKSFKVKGKSTPIRKGTRKLDDKSLLELVELQLASNGLPQLSAVEQAKFDLQLAIDQLYYSSKLEGSILTTEMIDNAVHGKETNAA